jgi:hypothetical protein
MDRAGPPVYGLEGRPSGLILVGFGGSTQGEGANANVHSVVLPFAESGDAEHGRRVFLSTYRRRLLATGELNSWVQATDASSAEPASDSAPRAYPHCIGAAALRAAGNLEEEPYTITVEGLMLAGQPYEGHVMRYPPPTAGVHPPGRNPDYTFLLEGEQARVMIRGEGFTLAEVADLLGRCVDVTTRRDLLAQYADEYYESWERRHNQ